MWWLDSWDWDTFRWDTLAEPLDRCLRMDALHTWAFRICRRLDTSLVFRTSFQTGTCSSDTDLCSDTVPLMGKCYRADI